MDILDKIFIIQGTVHSPFAKYWLSFNRHSFSWNSDPTATVIIPPHHTENLSEVQKVPRVQENLPGLQIEDKEPWQIWFLDPAILALMTTEIAAVVGNLASAAGRVARAMTPDYNVF